MPLALKGPFISIPHVALVPFRGRRGRETRAQRIDLAERALISYRRNHLVIHPETIALVMLRLRADILPYRVDIRPANRFAFPKNRPFRSKGRFIIPFPGLRPGLAEATFQVERSQANDLKSGHWVTAAVSRNDLLANGA